MQLPLFASNIMAPVTKAIADNRSIEDIAGIIEEVRMFACPVCGHIMPDHSWIKDPANCLIPECPCKGMEFEEFDDEDLVTQIDNIIRGRAA